MMHVSIDLETKSSVDITKAGHYRYAQSDDFGILLFAYKVDDTPTQCLDLASGEEIPQDVRDMLKDPDYVKHAFNAAFEWWCLNTAGYETPLGQWECTQAHARYCGLPSSLDAVGKALGLPADKQKMAAGKALIRYFCCPCKPTKTNGGRTWNLPEHDPDKWELFKKYNAQDVESEYEIQRRIKAYTWPEEEKEIWRRDATMNAYGVRVDMGLVRGALAIDAKHTESILSAARDLTGLENPNSTVQLTDWIRARTGRDVPNLRKDTVTDMVQDDTLPGDVHKALGYRQQLSRTSTKKYTAVATAVCKDGRVRGVSQYYGAGTGRWAGRLVQLQNLPRNYLGTLDEARRMVKAEDYDGIKAIYGDVPDTLSQLIRTAFIPSAGRKFVVADFSAIEARVLAWLAGESWANEVFRTTGKIYEATAAQMFHVSAERIVKGNPEYALRQKGKVATLALGYQGSTQALISMGALRMGIQEEELPDIVSKWRNANRRTVQLWHNLSDAVTGTVQTARPSMLRGLAIQLESDTAYGTQFLTIKLPSGRKKYYYRPSIQDNRYGLPELHYMRGDGLVTSAYGGKLVENVVQAIARDCLAVTLNRLWDKGLDVVFHVHDEVIVDAPRGLPLDKVCDIMGEPISWAPGLVLNGAGFEGEYYKKD